MVLVIVGVALGMYLRMKAKRKNKKVSLLSEGIEDVDEEI